MKVAIQALTGSPVDTAFAWMPFSPESIRRVMQLPKMIASPGPGWARGFAAYASKTKIDESLHGLETRYTHTARRRTPTVSVTAGHERCKQRALLLRVRPNRICPWTKLKIWEMYQWARRDTSSDVWIRRQSSMSIQKGTETTAAPNVIRVTAAGTDRLKVPAPSRVTIRSRKAWVLRRETSPTMRSTRQGMQ